MIIQQKVLGTNSTSGATKVSPEKPIKCLILDDNQFDRFRVRRIASKTGLCLEVLDATTLSEFADKLALEHYDLLIIDYRLSSGTGLEAIKIARDSTLNATTAMLMISDVGDADIANDAMELGCTDYVSKDELCADRLKRAIHEAINVPETMQTAKSDPSDSQQNRESAKKFAIAALKVATQTGPELTSVIDFLQALQSAPNRKERDNVLRRSADMETACLRIQSFLLDLAENGGQSALSREIKRTVGFHN